MSQYHEPVEELSAKTRDFTRALNSLKEEVEAIDWYQQRADTTSDPQLKSILEHNRDEEIEHACMALEWLRRNMPAWDEHLREFLFTEGEIGHHEEDEGGESEGSGGLGIGKIK
ncbi:encapsulin-associated ferritin-like protein [Limisalsivibrio acetivorans]|uniref:encapsulin-associated ferritin-like protein n=1 Tax=Limisalsivibrio acetivorans TaxID=1304888 RepID=UPI0003B350E6|nr:ferritin-like domain-containing protein [Limisalsivibrio acetivorans]